MTSRYPLIALAAAATLAALLSAATATGGFADDSTFDDVDKSASEKANDKRGHIGHKGGNGLAPVSSKADEDACRQASRALVTRDGKPFCGKPLDVAGEAECRKVGGNPVAIGKQKFCEMPAQPASTKPPG